MHVNASRKPRPSGRGVITYTIRDKHVTRISPEIQNTSALLDKASPFSCVFKSKIKYKHSSRNPKRQRLYLSDVLDNGVFMTIQNDWITANILWVVEQLGELEYLKDLVETRLLLQI